MNQFQKIIKYLSMAAAIFLSVFIIYSIVSFITMFFGVLDISDYWPDNTPLNEEVTDELVGDSFLTFDNVEGIRIKHVAGSLTIKEGDVEKVKVSSENSQKGYEIHDKDGTLIISDKLKMRGFFKYFGPRQRTNNLTIYLPKNYNLEKLEIEAGAGRVILEDFTANTLFMNAGAGAVSAKNIKANKTDLTGGVGSLDLIDVEFENGNIDCGVGKVYISGKLIANSKINSGVGEVILDLFGQLEDYNLLIEKGLGAISINGKEYQNVDFKENKADNTLEIKGGIGKIDINFK